MNVHEIARIDRIIKWIFYEQRTLLAIGNCFFPILFEYISHLNVEMGSGTGESKQAKGILLIRRTTKKEAVNA